MPRMMAVSDFFIIYLKLIAFELFEVRNLFRLYPSCSKSSPDSNLDFFFFINLFHDKRHGIEVDKAAYDLKYLND